MPDATSTDISILLEKAKFGETNGQLAATNALFDQLAVQLRSIAEGMLRYERAGHSLQATALVNETCLKILQGNVVDNADNRRQLFFAAIRAMRQVLVDHGKISQRAQARQRCETTIARLRASAFRSQTQRFLFGS